MTNNLIDTFRADDVHLHLPRGLNLRVGFDRVIIITEFDWLSALQLVNDRSRKNIRAVIFGLVGQSWAIVFSTADYNVRIYDSQPDNLASGMAAIREKMVTLEEKDALRGNLNSEEALNNIRTVSSIRECVETAIYIQECVFEDVDIKRSVIKEVVEYMSPSAVVASSSGIIYPSLLSEGLDKKERIIVAHPINPVHLIPLVEIIPTPWTDQTAVSEARRILSDVGQEPIVVKKETRGFIMSRIQHTITAECFKLIKDDVISVEDLEKLFPYGLGLRYAFLGVLETSYLNANGMEHFCSIYGEAIFRLQVDSGPPIKLEGEPLKKIQDALSRRTPLEDFETRRKWRDEKLVELLKLKNKKPDN